MKTIEIKSLGEIGRAAGEFRKADATEEALGILMMGGSLHEAV